MSPPLVGGDGTYLETDMDSSETHDMALRVGSALSPEQLGDEAAAGLETASGPAALSRTSTLDKQYVRASVKRRRPGWTSPGAGLARTSERSSLLLATAPSPYARTAAPLVRSASLSRSLDERLAAPAQDTSRLVTTLR